MTTTDPRSLAALQADAVRLLGTYQETPTEYRTPIVRQLAEVLVEARGSFLNDDGQQDYKGMTHNYRHWVSEVYDQAHIDREARAPIQASVRYHAGTVLREVLDTETLRELGLLPQSPKQRSIQRRSEKLALLNKLTGTQRQGGDLLALSAAFSVLSGVEGNDFEHLSQNDREVVATSLNALARRIDELRLRLLGNQERSGPRDDGPNYAADEQ